MKYLLLLLSLTLLSPTTHAQKITDPNAHLGLDQAYIDYICDLSNSLGSPVYDKIQNLTSFEEALYVAADKDSFLAALDEQSLPLPPESQVEVGKLWNAKYNQIYCPMGSNFIPSGYIEFKLLMSGQTKALDHLYSSNYNYKLNINRLLKLDPYVNDAEAKWVTLADLLKYYIENPVGAMTVRQEYIDRFKRAYKIVINEWGGKHFNELTDAEKVAAGMDLEKERLDNAEADKVESFYQLIEDNLKGKKVTISTPYKDDKVFYIDKDGNVKEDTKDKPIYMEADYNTTGLDIIIKQKRKDDEQHRLLLKTVFNLGAHSRAFYAEQTATGTNLRHKEEYGKHLTSINITHTNGVIDSIKYVYYTKTKNYTVKYEPWGGSNTYPVAALKSYQALYQYPKNWEEGRPVKFIDFQNTPISDFKVLKPKTIDYSSRYGRYENEGAYVVISANKMKGGVWSKSKNNGTVKEQIISSLNSTSDRWEYILKEHVIYHLHDNKSYIKDYYSDFPMLHGSKEHDSKEVKLSLAYITYKPNGDISIWNTTFKKVN
jgi:hypothetical protein